MQRVMRAAAAALMIASGVCAQETRSAIFGRVLDPQGSAVVGAAVTVTNADTNTVMSLTTNETGYFEANLLLPGNYRLTAEMAGFKKAVRSGIELAMSRRAEIDIRLDIGEAAETVSVTAEAPLLDVATVSAGRVMENRSVMDLPTFNNSPLMLIKLIPGMQASNNRRYNGVNALGGTAEAHNAGNVGGNDWSIDGVPDMGNGYSAAYLPYSTTISGVQSPDHRTSTPPSATPPGRRSPIMTKSGSQPVITATSPNSTGSSAGTAPASLSSRRTIAPSTRRKPPATTPRPSSCAASPLQPSGHSNNYAATVGGPVIIPKLINGKNKFFFFFSFDGFQRPQDHGEHVQPHGSDARAALRAISPTCSRSMPPSTRSTIR